MSKRNRDRGSDDEVGSFARKHERRRPDVPDWQERRRERSRRVRGMDPDELDDMLDDGDLDDDDEFEGPASRRRTGRDDSWEDGPADAEPGDGAFGSDGHAPRRR